MRSVRNLSRNSGCGVIRCVKQTKTSFVKSITCVSRMPIRTLLSMVFPDGEPIEGASILRMASQMKYRSLRQGRYGYLSEDQAERGLKSLSSGTTNSCAKLSKAQDPVLRQNSILL